MRRTLPQWPGWLFMAPALIFVAVFVLIPLGQLTAMSLTDRSLLGGGKFIGLANYGRIWNDLGFWRAPRLHRQIYARLDADPDGPGACARAAYSREHAAQASHPRHRFPSGGDWPLEFESPVVLAARRTGRAPQQASRRSAPDTRADRLVRQRRSRFLGGRHLDHLEGRRLRHGAVRGGNPVDQSRHPRGGAHGWGKLLGARPSHHPAADPPGGAADDAGQRDRLDAGLRPVLHHDVRRTARADVHRRLLDLPELVRLVQTRLWRGAFDRADPHHPHIRDHADRGDGAERARRDRRRPDERGRTRDSRPARRAQGAGAPILPRRPASRRS